MSDETEISNETISSLSKIPDDIVGTGETVSIVRHHTTTPISFIRTSDIPRIGIGSSFPQSQFPPSQSEDSPLDTWSLFRRREQNQQTTTTTSLGQVFPVTHFTEFIPTDINRTFDQGPFAQQPTEANQNSNKQSTHFWRSVSL